MKDDELIGQTEIATRLGVNRNRVYVWHHRGALPDPAEVIAGRPLWRWSQFTGWSSPRGDVTGPAAPDTGDDWDWLGRPPT